MAWYSQKNFDDDDAKVKESDDWRVEAIWGGSDGNSNGDDHGHIVTNDGVNASYYREPGGEVVVDDNPDSPTYTGN